VLQLAEHGFPDGRDGRVRVCFRRSEDALTVQVVDDGAGLPAGFTLSGSPRLGLQIVRTLVESELRGALVLTPARDGGTQVEVTLPLARAD
jgi:two-component sensor histidine kinase